MDKRHIEGLRQAGRELRWLSVSVLIGFLAAYSIAFADTVLLYDYFDFDDVHFLAFSVSVILAVWVLRSSRRFGPRVQWLVQATTVIKALAAGFLSAAVLAFVDTQLLGDNFDFDDVETTTFGLLLSVAVWCFLIVRNYSGSQATLDAFIDDKPLVVDGEARALIVHSLRLRARRLQNTARSVLFLIVATLFGGTAVFLTAGESARGESDPRRVVLSELERSISRLRSTARAAAVAAAVAESSRAEVAADAAAADAAAVAAAAAAAAKELNDAEQERNELAAEIATTPGTQDNVPAYAISVLSTRVGSVLLLVFLVQILTTLYRYNTRLSAFLDARADALQLAGVGRTRFAQLVKLLSPDTVDYGRAPKSPARQAVALTENLRAAGR